MNQRMARMEQSISYLPKLTYIGKTVLDQSIATTRSSTRRRPPGRHQRVPADDRREARHDQRQLSDMRAGLRAWTGPWGK